ncbi:MAG: response regulator, partial [Clostridia bacterium]|nr:response regulator [Clostridia bacterium]
MYTVVIADDEKWVLYKLLNTFRWQDYDFEVIGQTSNPDELLNMIVEQKPDAVLTDINMPGMSGIELIKKAQEAKSKSTFVLISGYADFQYAQQAIKQGVFRYLLKPVSQDDADLLLENLHEYLDEKHGVFSNMDIDTSKNEDFKKMISYINDHYCEKLQLNELSQKFDINMTYCCYLFNKNFNCSFSKYILKCRMDKAAELILNSDLSIVEISEKLGYDYYHF